MGKLNDRPITSYDHQRYGDMIGDVCLVIVLPSGRHTKTMENHHFIAG